MLIVVGIGTEVGKTVVSAILVEALQADYWKPVQSGSEAQTDTETIKQWVTPLPTRTFHPETYSLQAPLSPHQAAALEGITIEPERLTLPATARPLVVELAGGLLVPITPNFLNKNLIKQLALPVVVVANYYLGSINHTLLTIEVLDKYGIDILGIVFNGTPNTASRDVILHYTGLPLLAEIPAYEHITPEIIRQEAARDIWKSLL